MRRGGSDGSELFTLGRRKILKAHFLTAPLLLFPMVAVSETPLRRQAQKFFLLSFQPRQHP